MSLDSVVQISVTANTSTPSQRGFGTPLIMAYHTLDSDQRVRTYEALADMVTDGFALTSGAYLAAVAIRSQNPSPPSWKVGRRADPYVQQISLTVNSTEEGSVRRLTIRSPQGVENTVEYTVPAGATGGSIAAAFAALLCSDGPTGPTGAVGPTGIGGATGPYGVVANFTGSTVVITTGGTGATGPQAGLLADFSGWDAGFTLTNITKDSGIASDLAAVVAEDPDFYGICLDSNGSEEVRAAAAAVEAMTAILAVDSSDTGCTLANSTTDVFRQLANSAYARTVPYFNGTRVLHYSGAAALGQALPQQPGSATWAHKVLRGVPFDTVTARNGTAKVQLRNRHANTYYAIGGIGTTLWGTTASGEYADVTVFCDWLRIRMQERLMYVLQANRKIPYTDGGTACILSEVNAQLNQGVAVGGLAADPAPYATAPKVADVSPATRANRILPDVRFYGTLAGAIHSLVVIGTISV